MPSPDCPKSMSAAAVYAPCELGDLVLAAVEVRPGRFGEEIQARQGCSASTLAVSSRQAAPVCEG